MRFGSDGKVFPMGIGRSGKGFPAALLAAATGRRQSLERLLALRADGRTLSLMLDGPYDGWWMPMLVEATTVILALIGSRVLPHHVMGDSEGLPG